MARRATIQLKVHRHIVQSIPLDDADINCLIQGLRLVTPCTPRIDRLIELLEQIGDGGRQGTGVPSRGFRAGRALDGRTDERQKVCPAVILAKGPDSLTNPDKRGELEISTAQVS